MLGLKVRLEGLYFTTFRNPTTTSLIMSYSIPPYTTIRGLISNALGFRRDELSIQEWIKIGIRPLSLSNKSTEMAKILKLKGTGETYQKTFPSSPIFREFLVSPVYEIYLVGEDDKICRIYDAMLMPARPLYIGTSDDLLDVGLSDPARINEAKTRDIVGIIEGIHEDCFVEKIPYRFLRKGKGFSLEYKTVSIPRNDVTHLGEEIAAWRFDGRNVWVT